MKIKWRKVGLIMALYAVAFVAGKTDVMMLDIVMTILSVVISTEIYFIIKN